MPVSPIFTPSTICGASNLANFAKLANAHVGPWLHNVAHQRIHGSTQQRPQVLLEQERHSLGALPALQVFAPIKAAGLSIARPIPIESLQHKLSVYDQLLVGRLLNEKTAHSQHAVLMTHHFLSDQRILSEFNRMGENATSGWR